MEVMKSDRSSGGEEMSESEDQPRTSAALFTFVSVKGEAEACVSNHAGDGLVHVGDTSKEECRVFPEDLLEVSLEEGTNQQYSSSASGPGPTSTPQLVTEKLPQSQHQQFTCVKCDRDPEHDSSVGCTKCGLGLCGKKDFQRSVSNPKTYRSNNAKKPPKCVDCGLWHMPHHLCQQHNVVEVFECNDCGETFSVLRDLKLHVGTHVGKKINVCDVCNKGFSKPANLKEHYRTHTGERPYVCDVCKMAFAHSGHLNKHYRTHTGEKPHICDICNKGFARSEHLKVHRRIHTGEKPYVCKICNKNFIESKLLKAHHRTHTGEKPFECTICTKKFAEAQLLKKHRRRHSGLRPHICTVCNKSFSEFHNLKEHFRIHSGENPYVCKVCKKAFAHPANLRKHVKIHARDKPSSRKKLKR